MNTHDKIELPPLPTFEQAESACKNGEDGPLERFIYENEPADAEATVGRWRESIRSVMYAAVEADRQGRMPSDEDLDDLSDEFHGYSGNHTRDGYLIPKFNYIGYARALLSRYSSGQPAASAKPWPTEEQRDGAIPPVDPADMPPQILWAVTGKQSHPAYYDDVNFARRDAFNRAESYGPEDETRITRFVAPVAQEPDAKAVATAFRDRLINDLASLEDCYLSRESIEMAAEDVLHSFTALAAPVAAQVQTDHDEDAYVIASMGRLLAEIAVIVRGAEQPLHRHGYADLPARVAALKAESVAAQAQSSGNASDEPEWLQSLRLEARDLSDRLDRLSRFRDTAGFRMLTDTDQGLLDRQGNQMHALLQTLNQRIHSGAGQHRRSKSHD